MFAIVVLTNPLLLPKEKSIVVLFGAYRLSFAPSLRLLSTDLASSSVVAFAVCRLLRERIVCSTRRRSDLIRLTVSVFSLNPKERSRIDHFHGRSIDIRGPLFSGWFIGRCFVSAPELRSDGHRKP